MSKRILIVVESLNCGGAEKSLVSMLPQLDYSKFNIDLLIYNRGGIFEKFVYEKVNILPQLDFVSFCQKSIIRQLFSFRLKYLFYRLKWAFAIRNPKNRKRHASEVYWENCKKVINAIENNYDIAVAWGQGNSTHYVAEKVSAKKKYAWINADYLLGNHDQNFDRPFYKKMNKLIVVSDRLLSKTQSVFPEFRNKMIVIYDIINANLIQKMSIMEDVNLDSDKLKIVTVGRLEPPKGLCLAVEASKILREKNIDFIWYIVGEGSQRVYLEKKIHEYKLEKFVKLEGLKANPYPYIRNADIYVQTSVFEGYCLTLAEARVLNRPIVSTNFDVVFDQIKNERNGLIVKKTPESIAEAINRLNQNPELCEFLISELKKEEKGNFEEVEKIIMLFNE